VAARGFVQRQGSRLPSSESGHDWPPSTSPRRTRKPLLCFVMT